MPHPKAHLPITPHPWSICTHHINATRINSNLIKRSQTRQDAMAWLEARGCLDPISSEDGTPLYIMRADIPEFLYTPDDVVLIRGHYTTPPHFILDEDDLTILPTLFLHSISTHTATNQHRIRWVHQTPADWPIDIMIIRHYDRSIHGHTMTLNAEPRILIDISIKKPQASPLRAHEGMHRITLDNIHKQDITSVHALIQDALTTTRHTPVSHHRLMEMVRSIPTIIDPDLFTIVAPRYTID